MGPPHTVCESRLRAPLGSAGQQLHWYQRTRDLLASGIADEPTRRHLIKEYMQT